MLIFDKIRIGLLAVMVAVIFAGCAMKRDVAIVDEKVNRMWTEQRETARKINHLDSLLSADTDESVLLRAEIRTSLSELMEQFRIMQANMTDLQQKLNYMAERGTSPGVIIPPTSTGPAGVSDSAAAQAVTPGINCQELYDESFINIRRGQYDEAIGGFNDYLKYCSTQELADNARFWIAESYYSTERFKEAISEFDLLLKDYPNSEKKPATLYKMARSYEELGQKTEARKTFQKLVDEYAGTLEAEQAKEKLKELK
nr:tol-pal system protein YbgF [candidate division Zixibacteria bacterium]